MESSPTPPTKGRSFVSRLGSTVLLWALVLTAIAWQNPAMILGLTCLMGMLSTVEYFNLVAQERAARPYALLGIGIALAWWACTLRVALAAAPGSSLAAVMDARYDLGALVLALQGSFLLAYRGHLEGAATLQRIFATVFGVFYTVICFGFIARLMLINGNGRDISLALYVIATTKFTDMGAYAVGSLFGKHKMIPHISPAKSWEGLAGALLGTSVATGLMWLLIPAARLAPLTPVHSLVLIPIICFTAVTGDLAESIIKRCVAIKDSGHKLPGIGGILDLTDSLLFTAPVVYFYLVR